MDLQLDLRNEKNTFMLQLRIHLATNDNGQNKSLCLLCPEVDGDISSDHQGPKSVLSLQMSGTITKNTHAFF